MYINSKAFYDFILFSGMKNHNCIYGYALFSFENYYYYYYYYYYYQQIDGAAMRCSLVPTLKNAFLGFHEQIWLNECPDEFKSVYYRRSVMTFLVCFVHLIILRNLKIKDFI